MRVSKKRSIIALLFLIISLPFQTNAMMGPQVNITDYKSMFTNFLRQTAASLQNAFSNIAASFSSSLTTTTSSLPNKVSVSSFSFSAPPKWVMLAGAVLVGGTIAVKTGALKKFLDYINPPSPLREEPSDFKKLPADAKKIIIVMLSTYPYIQNLQEAAKTINSLSQVDKELNALINSQQFFLELIKILAQQFNITDEQATHALAIKGAKDRLTLQQSLLKLCEQTPNPSHQDYANKAQEQLEALKKKEVDLNFVYGSIQKSNTTTALIKALEHENYTLAQVLINQGCDINQTIPAGEFFEGEKTALAHFINIADDKISLSKVNTSENTLTKPLEFLLNQKAILVDQKIGRSHLTALNIITLYNRGYLNPKILELLLNARANPTISNGTFSSPEYMINSSNDHPKKQILIDLIEKAKKEKKWEKLSP